MIYSTGCEYAIRAIAELARDWPSRHYVLLRSLSRRSGLPAPYLAKMLQRLALAGLVRSLKGRTGGYRLARDPRQLSLIHIVKAIDGTDRLARCVVGLGTWHAQPRCPQHRAWASMRNQLISLLERTTVADLAEALACKRCRSPARR